MPEEQLQTPAWPIGKWGHLVRNLPSEGSDCEFYPYDNMAHGGNSSIREIYSWETQQTFTYGWRGLKKIQGQYGEVAEPHTRKTCTLKSPEAADHSS